MFHGYMVQETNMVGNDTGLLLNSFHCSFIQMLNVFTCLHHYGKLRWVPRKIMPGLIHTSNLIYSKQRQEKIEKRKVMSLLLLLGGQ